RAFVPAPTALARAAEGRVHHDDDEAPPGDEGAGDAFEDGVDGVDVLDGEHAGRGVEAGLGEGGQVARVADAVVDVGGAALACGGAARACAVGGRRRGVGAGGGDVEGAQAAAEDALAACDVDDARAGGGGEEAEHAGEDDVAVVVAALVADEAVVPVGDVVPV